MSVCGGWRGLCMQTGVPNPIKGDHSFHNQAGFLEEEKSGLEA